jgi:hypothetical protein
MRIGEKRRDCGLEGVFSDSDRAVRVRTLGDVPSAIRKVAELRRISGEFRTVLSLFSLGESMMPMI